MRSKWTELPKITRFALEGWAKAHEAELEVVQNSLESAQLPEVPDSWARLRRKNWARLLKKVYEVHRFSKLEQPAPFMPAPFQLVRPATLTRGMPRAPKTTDPILVGD